MPSVAGLLTPQRRKLETNDLSHGFSDSSWAIAPKIDALKVRRGKNENNEKRGKKRGKEEKSCVFRRPPAGVVQGLQAIHQGMWCLSVAWHLEHTFATGPRTIIPHTLIPRSLSFLGETGLGV